MLALSKKHGYSNNHNCTMNCKCVIDKYTKRMKQAMKMCISKDDWIRVVSVELLYANRVILMNL